MLIFYHFLLLLFKSTAPFFLGFSAKGRDWLEGQKIISNAIGSLENKYISSKCIWMHCASLGEYEQGKPLLQELKGRFPDYKIVLTVFSPSGFKLEPSFFDADDVCPLLLDGKNEARKWIKAVHPQIAIFVKQEFWYHYLKELNLQKIPVFLISGTISNSILLKFGLYKNWYLKLTELFTILFLQSKIDFDRAKNYGLTNAMLSGNTRVDSVWKNKEFQWENTVLASFTHESNTFIFGSAWTEDIPLLNHLLENPLFKSWKIIWAPHDISLQHINRLKEALPKNEGIQLFSESNTSDIKSRILVLNTIGILKYAYRYAQLVYVGGGFGKGIHNLLEPIVYQIPVVFGPNYHAFPEAHHLKMTGGGFCAENLAAWKLILDKLENPVFRNQCGMIASSYIVQNMGTINNILPYLYTVLDKKEHGKFK